MLEGRGKDQVALFVVAKNSTMVNGEMNFYYRKADSGNIVSHWFYSDCGPLLMNKTTSYPDDLIYYAVTLDDPDVLNPHTVVFSRSSQPWDYISLELK